MTTAEMVRGLVRCAELKEQNEGGRLWDDSSREALAEARRRGWGKDNVGSLAPERDVDIDDGCQMLALSVKPWWGYCILHGKGLENRTWNTTFRGYFLLHASSQGRTADYTYAQVYAAKHGVTLPPEDELYWGGIIGIAKLVDIDESPDAAHLLKPWEEVGGYAYKLTQQFALPFVPCKGLHRFWRVPESVVREVAKQHARAIGMHGLQRGLSAADAESFLIGWAAGKRPARKAAG